MKLIKLVNPENVSEKEVANYRVREAVRAIVVDRDGLIALLHVTKENYYKLPGGGIEHGEDKFNALKRECQEEIGCDIEVMEEIGTIVEYRKIFYLKQTSYCYLTEVKGEKGVPNYTDEEKANDFRLIWLPPKKALVTLSESHALNIEGRDYIVPRDTALLEQVTLIDNKF